MVLVCFVFVGTQNCATAAHCSGTLAVGAAVGLHGTLVHQVQLHDGTPVVNSDKT